MKYLLPLLPLAASTAFAASTLYNFDLARNRSGVELNASNGDSNLVLNTAAPSGTSTMTWNVTRQASESLASNTMPLTDGVSYVRFDGLVADVDGRISGTFGTPAGTGTAALAGLQFGVVPEPSAAVLGLLGSLALLCR